ncbi:MAG: phosphate regulon transcriptional regulatory protein PhoB [Alphaproteobacteria bacterium]|nr:phosphate regulon transcriptional regulatory protein PhoB [Alphaproteobacteria bacterium]
MILVVEDEAPLAEVLRYNLEGEGFRVAVAGDGRSALERLEETPPDLVVLDWMLPEVSGLEICRTMRRRPELREVPVIMLTAKGEEHDRVRGLDAGADDYVVKPFSPKELVSRVRAVLRRTKAGASGEPLRAGPLEMDLETHRVRRDGVEVQLAPTEFRLLRVLLERPGRVYSREQLLDLVWGRDIYVEARTVDVHIRRLRVALNQNGQRDLIRTVRSEGYALEPEGV